jgi:hypothetical protein
LWVKPGAYSREEHLKGSSVGQVLALQNIRLGQKSLPGKNALAYWEHLITTSVKSFIR